MAEEATENVGADTTVTDTSQTVDTASLMDTVAAGTEQTPEGEGEEPKTEEKPEATTEGDKPKEEDKKTEDKDEPEGAPEEYSDFEVPEGVTLDASLVDEFKAEAKAEGLTQEQAQKRIDQGVKLSQGWTRQAIEAHQAQVNSWRDSTMNDPEIGGDKLATTLAGAKEVRDTFGSEGLTEVLDTFGLGNHPEVIRFFSKVRGAISDDTFVKDGKPTGAPTRAADVLFGNTNKKQEG